MSYSAADLERLVQIITEEVLHAAGSPPVGGRCACHAVHAECCPDHLRGVLDAGASRLGLQASGAPAGSVAGLIDHTLLKQDATQAEIETLCREAREYAFATVCLNPTWVPLAARLLRGSPVGVCTVVGFPLGATTADVKQYETRRVIFDGATPADVALMRRVVGTGMGVKAAGGVRDLVGAQEMVKAGATRIGASAGVRIVQESKETASSARAVPKAAAPASAGGGY
jgi:deoxyribose-phosphate aldolase